MSLTAKTPSPEPGMVDLASATLASSKASLFLGPSPNEVLVAGL